MLYGFAWSIEWCVVAAVVAAAVLALCARPSGRGSAVTTFVEGTLVECGDGDDSGAWIHASVDDCGGVEILRTGLENIPMSSHLSLAVTRVGFDIELKEREAIAGGAPTARCVRFRLGGLGAERYHVVYRCERTKECAAFTIKIKPGIKIDKALN